MNSLSDRIQTLEAAVLRWQSEAQNLEEELRGYQLRPAPSPAPAPLPAAVIATLQDVIFNLDSLNKGLKPWAEADLPAMQAALEEVLDALESAV